MGKRLLKETCLQTGKKLAAYSDRISVGILMSFYKRKFAPLNEKKVGETVTPAT